MKETDIAWLAGIIDGEGCFSVKNPVKRGRGRTCHQLWLVVCNTSESMMLRVQQIYKELGVGPITMRKVWKGKKATRWQYWLNIAQMDDLLLVTKALLPHLTAKRVEASVFIWFLTRACAQRAYKRTEFDKLVLSSLSAVKRNGGEAPAEVLDLLRVVIPSEVAREVDEASSIRAERVETRRDSNLSDDPAQELPATEQLRLVR